MTIDLSIYHGILCVNVWDYFKGGKGVAVTCLGFFLILLITYNS
jgi:glycerol-3-phosphate acyltransferase PlsY